jgi:hypothetical protein
MEIALNGSDIILYITFSLHGIQKCCKVSQYGFQEMASREDTHKGHSSLHRTEMKVNDKKRRHKY